MQNYNPSRVHHLYIPIIYSNIMVYLYKGYFIYYLPGYNFNNRPYNNYYTTERVVLKINSKEVNILTKYKDILKSEFKDSLAHFKRDRSKFHLFVIDRLFVNGSILYFDYHYLPSENSSTIIKEIDLQDFGSLKFEIDINTSYGTIVTDDYLDVIDKFLEEYDIHSESETISP